MKTGVGGGAPVRQERRLAGTELQWTTIGAYTGVSGPRDSTTAPGYFIPLLDWAIAAALALTVLVFLVGVDIHLGGVTVRSHSAMRVIAGVVALVLVRVWFESRLTRNGSCGSRC